MRRTLAALAAGVTLASVSAAPAAAQVHMPPPNALPGGGKTVVSLTFDDGYKSQLEAAEYLDENDLKGTFYISAGQIAFDAYMDQQDLLDLAGDGHEIGGHALTHQRLADKSLAQVEKEVCQDRAALAKLGLPTQNFAYPHGSYDEDVIRMVKQCGYNSARASSGLNGGGNECEACPPAEPLPLTRWFNIRTAGSATGGDESDWKAQVEQARSSGGGWVPFIFHQVCTPDSNKRDCGPLSVDQDAFEDFVDWLVDQDDVSVVPVNEIVGGRFAPVVGSAPAQVGGLPPFDDIARRDSLSNAAAWVVFGIPIGQQQVILFALAAGLVGSVLYRLATRGQQYQSKPTSTPVSHHV